jgi:hypothetical protein
MHYFKKWPAIIHTASKIRPHGLANVSIGTERRKMALRAMASHLSCAFGRRKFCAKGDAFQHDTAWDPRLFDRPGASA